MKKKKEKKKVIGKETPSPPPPADDKDGSFDFGGMPARDLKKNLGCG
jgi:hypothetical protein